MQDFTVLSLNIELTITECPELPVFAQDSVAAAGHRDGGCGSSGARAEAVRSRLPRD